MRCCYLNLQLIKSAVINQKGPFAPLAPPAKGQGGQLPVHMKLNELNAYERKK